ncbi:hypothetical protein MG293_014231 [Ovis ammon polii]|uniref:Uncharacterized protein n=1 Tax=Ovis ammon polii TaxID=230172 RepID=A0AAD4U0W4_OVIAM|nr:hypothetical protein MG293_014231 [Ovis ammon polii]KAI4561406.1 hypothetical protein MJT46_012096 [Ovis ammon polii x Ovis aries]
MAKENRCYGQTRGRYPLQIHNRVRGCENAGRKTKTCLQTMEERRELTMYVHFGFLPTLKLSEVTNMTALAPLDFSDAVILLNLHDSLSVESNMAFGQKAT